MYLEKLLNNVVLKCKIKSNHGIQPTFLIKPICPCDQMGLIKKIWVQFYAFLKCFAGAHLILKTGLCKGSFLCALR